MPPDTNINQPVSPELAAVLQAKERLRTRVGPDVDVQIKPREGVIVVQTVDGSDFEPVVLPDGAPLKVVASATPSGSQPLGEAGYKRLMELLQSPPLNVPGLPPPGTGVPTDLKEWLVSFKEPLVYMTVGSAMSALQAKLGGYSRGRLKELYMQMSPEEVAAVMQGNAATIRKFADQRAAEAAMIQSVTTKVTEAGASLLLKLLAVV